MTKKTLLLLLVLLSIKIQLNGQVSLMSAIIAYPDTSTRHNYSNLPSKHLDEMLLYSGYKHDVADKFGIKLIKGTEGWVRIDSISSDTSNKRKSETDFDSSGLVTRFYEAPGMVEEKFFFYDSNKNLILSCYKVQNQKCDTSNYYIYNEKKQLIEEGEFLANCCGDTPPKIYYKYFYDEQDRLIKSEEYWFKRKANSFLKENCVVYCYDSIGRRSAMKTYTCGENGNDNVKDVNMYKYDSLNRVVLDSCDEETFHYKYGANGFLIEKVQFSKAINTPIIVSNFTYNNRNQLIEGITSSNNYYYIKTTYEYNPDNKIKKKKTEQMEKGKVSSSEHIFDYYDNGLQKKSTSKYSDGTEIYNIFEYEFY